MEGWVSGWAGLTSQDAWNARQFLERQAATAGIRYEEADQPNLRRYRFPRPDGVTQ